MKIMYGFFSIRFVLGVLESVVNLSYISESCKEVVCDELDADVVRKEVVEQEVDAARLSGSIPIRIQHRIGSLQQLHLQEVFVHVVVHCAPPDALLVPVESIV